MLSTPRRRTALPTGPAWEFLSTVLEMEESPPSPIRRTIAWTISTVLTVALLWAAFSTVDLITVAQGELIPSDYSKVIQPLESGVGSAIHVQNGQEVQQSQVLIELEAAANSTDHARLVNEHQAASVEIASLQAWMAGKETLEAPPRGTGKDEGCVESIAHTDHSPHCIAEWPRCVASVVVSTGDGSIQTEESRKLIRHERSTDEQP
jgi:hypothetical protein